MNETKLIRDVFRAGAIFAMHYLDGKIPPEHIEAECEIFINRLIREDDEFSEDKK
jgi:hypothetical protein